MKLTHNQELRIMKLVGDAFSESYVSYEEWIKRSSYDRFKELTESLIKEIEE